MRYAARLAGVLLLVGGLAACDKAQVEQLQMQFGTVSFRATGIAVERLNVWDVFEDTDNDNQPDPGTTPFLYCETIFTGGGPPLTIPVNSAPWPHSLKISVLRADSTEFEDLIDVAYLAADANMTSYDDRVIFGSNNIPKPPVTVAGRVFKWTNARQMSTLNREVVQAVAATNTLNQLDPGTYPYLDGLCSLADPGPATLAGVTAPLTIEIGKGETVRIEARKAISALPELAAIFGNINPVMSATMTVDGFDVSQNLQGSLTSTSDPASGVSFFYTSR